MQEFSGLCMNKRLPNSLCPVMVLANGSNLRLFQILVAILVLTATASLRIPDRVNNKQKRSFTMSKKPILIAYATRAGSTRDVSDTIGKSLVEHGALVEHSEAMS